MEQNNLSTPDDQFAGQVISVREHLEIIKEKDEKIVRLTKLAYTDDLTGVFNFPAFRMVLEKVHQNSRQKMIAAVQERRKKEERPKKIDSHQVVFLDLNGFKQVNDTFGHTAGDLVLRAVAEVLASQVRKTDIVARRGGDEFFIILVNATQKAATRVMCKIMDRLGELEVDFGANGMIEKISCSYGICPVDPMLTPAQILDIVDARMYMHKRGVSDFSPGL